MFTCPYERSAIHQQVMLAQKIAAGGGAAPARVSFTKKQGTGATAGINSTGANTLIVVFFSATGSTPTISSDTYSNTWTLQVNTSGTGGDRIRLYTATGASVGTGHTVTPAGTDGATITHFISYSGGTGVELPGGLDDTSSPFAISTSGATTVANSLIFTAGEANTGATPNVHTCTGATVFSEEQDYGTYWGGAVADETVSTTGTKTETWSVSSSPAATSYLMAIIVIKGT